MMNGKIVDQYWYVDISDIDTIEFSTYEEAYQYYTAYRSDQPEAWITLGCVTDRVVGTFADRDPPDPHVDDYDDLDFDVEV